MKPLILLKQNINYLDVYVLQMAAYMRLWRLRKKGMDHLLQDSDSDDNLPVIANTSESDNAPGTPDSDSDNVAGTTNTFDFNTDVDHGSTDSEEELDDEAEVQVNFEEDLRQWAIKNRATHRSVNELLSVLRKHGHPLPMDARTLLATPQDKASEAKCGGQYMYYGLEKGICRFLSQTKSNAVHLSVNIDGIPLFKSSCIQFWPILAKFSHFDPFIVAIFSGQKKPSPLDEYLNDFLMEYQHLKDNGIVYKGQTYTVDIEALICDASKGISEIH